MSLREMELRGIDAPRRMSHWKAGSTSLGRLGSVSLDADKDTSVAEQLRAALDKNLSRVIDLFREWDADDSGTVSKVEFRQVLPVLGLKVPEADADALFDEFDADGSGTMEYVEVVKKLRKRRANKPIHRRAAGRPKSNGWQHFETAFLLSV